VTSQEAAGSNREARPRGPYDRLRRCRQGAAGLDLRVRTGIGVRAVRHPGIRTQPVVVKKHRAVALLPLATFRALLPVPKVSQRSVEKAGVREDSIDDQVCIVPTARAVVVVDSLAAPAVNGWHIPDVVPVERRAWLRPERVYCAPVAAAGPLRVLDEIVEHVIIASAAALPPPTLRANHDQDDDAQSESTLTDILRSS
jgi:hypothetical protein